MGGGKESHALISASCWSLVAVTCVRYQWQCPEQAERTFESCSVSSISLLIVTDILHAAACALCCLWQCTCSMQCAMCPLFPSSIPSATSVTLAPSPSASG